MVLLSYVILLEVCKIFGGGDGGSVSWCVVMVVSINFSEDWTVFAIFGVCSPSEVDWVISTIPRSLGVSMHPSFSDDHETMEKLLPNGFKQRQTLSWSSLMVVVVDRSEQTHKV